MKKLFLMVGILLLLMSCQNEVKDKENGEATDESVVLDEVENDSKTNESESEEPVSDNSSTNDTVSNDTVSSDTESNDDESEEPPKITQYRYFRVLCETLNVRETPDEEGKIIGKLKENYTSYILEEKTDDEGRLWYKTADSEGWIASWYCKRITLYPADDNPTYAAINVDDQVNIMASPAQGSEVIGELYVDEKLQILNTYFDSNDEYWYKVINHKGIIGWIAGKSSSEYRSDTGRIKTMIQKMDVLISTHTTGHPEEDLESLLEDVPRAIDGAKTDYVMTFGSHKTFCVILEDVQYVYHWNFDRNVVSLVASNSYVMPDILYAEDYLSFEYFNGVEIEKRVLTLNASKLLNTATPLIYDESYYLADLNILIYEQEARYSDLLSNKDRLTDINYYNLETDEVIPFKVATVDYDWTLELDDSVLKIYRNDWFDDKMIGSELYLESKLMYWEYRIAKDETYLPSGRYQEHLDKELESFSDGTIIKHVKALAYITLNTTIEVFSDFETTDFLYFNVINAPIDQPVDVEDTVLLRWQKGTHDYEWIDKIDFESYISKALPTASYDTIVDYITRSKMYTRGAVLEEVYETDSLYIFEVMLINDSIPEDYVSLIIWDKNYRYGGMVTTQTANGLIEIIEDNLLVTMVEDFVVTYNFYNLKQYGNEAFFIGSINASQYKRLADSDWIILETTHPSEDRSWSIPFVTEIDFMNIQTGEIKKYLTSDETTDWVYIYDEMSNIIRLIQKVKHIKLDQSEQTEYEVINLNNVEPFILKIEAM